MAGGDDDDLSFFNSSLRTVGSTSAKTTVMPWFLQYFLRIKKAPRAAVASTPETRLKSMTTNSVGEACAFEAGVPSRHSTEMLCGEVASEENFYDTVESAIKFCETHLSTRSVANDMAGSHGHIESVSLLLHRFMGESEDPRPALDGVDQYFREVEIPAGYEFYRVAQHSGSFYFLARGRVAIFKNADSTTDPDKPLAQLKTVGPSSMFGEVAFISQQLRHTAATAMEPCSVYEMSRERFAAMKTQAPMLSLRLRDVVVQSMARSITSLTLTDPGHPSE